MNNIKKIHETATQLEGVYKMLASSGCVPLAVLYISNAKDLLSNIQVDINTVEGKRILAESQRDSLLLAIAGTNEGRNLELSDPNKAIPQAMCIVRTMDADIRTSREADEIPFGAVEQDSDKMQLEQRIAELELQFELKVDECTATENHLREYKARWISLTNLFNAVDPQLSVYGLPDYIGGMHSALLNTEATIFRRRYYHNGAHTGGVIYNSPRIPGKKTSAILCEIYKELDKATDKHPSWPHDPIHAAAILVEEAGKLTQAAIDYEYHGADISGIQNKAARVGAMALRVLLGLEQYRTSPTTNTAPEPHQK